LVKIWAESGCLGAELCLALPPLLSQKQVFYYLMIRLKDVEARPTKTAVARNVTPKSRAIRW
jgi:F420-0:gamma-glutamyl ligase-like protein